MLAGGAIGAANPGSLSDRISNAGAGATMAAAIPKTPDVLAAGGKFVDQAVTPVKNAVGEYVTNIPSEVWSDITQPNSQVWDLIKDSYMQDKAGGGTTPLPVQDFENRIIKGIRGDVDTQYHNLGAQVADAKNKMFNDFETAKSQEMYEAMHRAQNKAQTIEGINTGNLDTAVADSSARLDTLKNKYFQIKHDITPDNPKAAYLHEQLIQTQRDLTSEIRNNLNIKKRNLEKQNYDAESIDNAMRDELDRLAQKYTIHPDLRSAISKLKSVTNDRQFSGAPLAGSIKSILRELKEGVAPYRAQKLMDMLDYEVINYDKSMSELPYWSRELQSASKDARTNIDKTLTSLDPEYKAAKTKFHDFKILQEDEALNGILQPSKANPTSGAIKKLYSLNDKGNGLTKDALSRISSNPNQLFSDIRTANTAWNGYDAMKEAYAIPLSHSLIYNLIKGLPAPIRSVAFKPDSAVPMIENYQRLNALKQRLGRTTPIPQINPARLAPLSATASKRKKNI
jgi:hypothetical protein